jgi:crotonobetainyl-CoA:carnitine CoA-transferase CaiB-like acyl-CoA transferase
VRNRGQCWCRSGSGDEDAAKAEWLAALEAAKVPCGAINNLAEVFADPHVQRAAW